MSPRILPIEEGQALTHYFSTYVDVTVVNSALAGLILLVGMIWAVYAFHRLWQGSLAEDAAAGIDAAEASGLVLQPAGFGPQLLAEGEVDGERVQVVWRGGVLGARSVVRRGRRSQRLPLIADAAALEAALGGGPDSSATAAATPAS